MNFDEYDDELVAALKGSFKNFLWYIWKYLKLPDPTDVQYDIADALTDCPARFVIQAYRGAGKSWICSAWAVWLLWNNPQLKILVISASKDRSDAFVIFCKRLINDLPILSEMRSRPGQRDSTVLFDVGLADPAHAPSLKAIGINGQLAGNRADILISDDVESIKNSLTQTMRERLGEAIKEYDAILTPKPDSKIVYLGTPQSENSIYNLLNDRGFITRIWPVRKPKDETVYGGNLAPFVTNLYVPPGTPVDPARFNDEELIKREASYGRSGFALQFMLNPRLSDGDRRPLKLADLMVLDCSGTKAPLELVWGRGENNRLHELPAVGLNGDHWYSPMFISPDYAEFTGCVMAIDPAGAGTDDTGYAIVKILNGILYVVDAGGLPGGFSDETLLLLANMAKKHQVNEIVVESNLGIGMFAQLLKPVLVRVGHPTTIELVHHSVQKERRIIETLEPIMNQHRLVVDRELILRDYKSDRDVSYSLFYQMTRLTPDRGSLGHDDAIDVLSMAVAYWVEAMARDNAVAASEDRQKALEERLSRFHNGIFAPKKHSKNTTRSTNW
jgi:hypothetical protein